MAPPWFYLVSFEDYIMPFECLRIEDGKIARRSAPIAFGTAHCEDVMLVKSGSVLALGFIFRAFDGNPCWDLLLVGC